MSIFGTPTRSGNNINPEVVQKLYDAVQPILSKAITSGFHFEQQFAAPVNVIKRGGSGREAAVISAGFDPRENMLSMCISEPRYEWYAGDGFEMTDVILPDVSEGTVNSKICELVVNVLRHQNNYLDIEGPVVFEQQ